MFCFLKKKKITPGRKMIVSHLHFDIKELTGPFLIDKLEKEPLKD